MIYVKKIATVVSLAVLLASGTVYAESTSTPMVQEAQKDGAVLLKNSYTYLGDLVRYAFKADLTNEINVDGGSIITKRTSEVKVKRPDQFRVDSKSEYINRSFYLSNGVFTMIDNNEKYYASVKTGGNIDQTLDKINKKLGIALPLATLLHSDMVKFIHPKRVQYFGTQTVNGVECDYIAFKQKNTVVHLWIENSESPLIRAAKIFTNRKSETGRTEMILKWDIKPGFSDSVFVFKAPKGASNISIKPAK